LLNGREQQITAGRVARLVHEIIETQVSEYSHGQADGVVS
jgi:hypothetical protein